MDATITRTSFLERLARGDVLIADGATGTTCQRMGLPIGVAPEEWVLTQPERILELHRGFAEAGSDIVLTCTFGGTGIRLADGPARRSGGRGQPPRGRAGARGRRPRRAGGRLAGPDGAAVRAARPALARRGGRGLCRAGRGTGRGRRRLARAGDDVLPARGRRRPSKACAGRPISRSCSRSPSTGGRAR